MAYVPRGTVPEALHKRVSLFKEPPRSDYCFRRFCRYRKYCKLEPLSRICCGRKVRRSSLAEPGQGHFAREIGTPLSSHPSPRFYFASKRYHSSATSRGSLCTLVFPSSLSRPDSVACRLLSLPRPSSVDVDLTVILRVRRPPRCPRPFLRP